jgi:hypothetical protein
MKVVRGSKKRMLRIHKTYRPELKGKYDQERIRRYFIHKKFSIVEEKHNKSVRLYRPKDLDDKTKGKRYFGSAKNYLSLFKRFKDVESFRNYSEVSYRYDKNQRIILKGNLDVKNVKTPSKVYGRHNKQVIMQLTGFRKVTDEVGWVVEGYSPSFKSWEYFNERVDDAYYVCVSKLGFTPQRIIIHKIDIREFR